MRVRTLRGALVGAACVVGMSLGGVGSVQAAAPEPEQILLSPLMAGTRILELDTPCGLAVATGRFYISSYYPNRVDWVKPSPILDFDGQLSNVDPLGGPCGLSIDSLGRIYVNNYHRNVERYSLSGGSFQTPTVIDTSHPTGVAVNPVSNDVYVNARTHLSAYGSNGAPLMDGLEPLKIGLGSLGDGYGLAVSQFPATLGRIYAPDYSTDTVKVYDPLVDKEDPVQAIAGPPGGFGSLRDSAVAVDRATGEIYVADTLAHPQHTEQPEAVIRVFAPDGTYKGRLKYAVIDGSPVGLAVDNTVGPTQGRVYVTSGNTIKAAVYVYPPGSATSQSAAPLVGGSPGPPGGDSGSGAGAGTASNTSPQSAPATTQPRSAHPSSVIEQRGNLRVTVEGRLAPKRLPRKGTAPIKVSVGGQIATTDQSLPPQLKTLQIELNRHGRLERRGLPSCRYEQIQPGSSKRALSACRSSLVGTGSFKANIILAGQEPYPSQGKLLVFNATEKGKPVLYGHIHTDRPFATSFVIVFELRQKPSGRYGTTLHARIPRSMDSWGRLTALEMTLGRTYRAKGKRRAYISAGCPAPKGFPGALFPLARTTFAFKDGKRIASTLISECKARR